VSEQLFLSLKADLRIQVLEIKVLAAPIIIGLRRYLDYLVYVPTPLGPIQLISHKQNEIIQLSY
jgi:hypothetical protein